MKPQFPTKSRRSVAAISAATSASWLALVAATGLGIGHVDRLRAEISAEPGAGAAAADGGYRLIVQSYAADAVGADERPQSFARPLASVQRAITAEELEKGVAVDIVQLGESAAEDAAASGGERRPRMVVAWIERGAPDLDFDALQARPAPDAFYAVAVAEDARLVLRRRS